jgi:hypothetical protein
MGHLYSGAEKKIRDYQQTLDEQVNLRAFVKQFERE